MIHIVLRDIENTNWRSFAPITTYDHAGYIWIATLFGMTMSLLVAATRIWIKKNAFGMDDSLFVAATVSLELAMRLLLTLSDRNIDYDGSPCHRRRGRAETGPWKQSTCYNPAGQLW